MVAKGVLKKARGAQPRRGKSAPSTSERILGAPLHSTLRLHRRSLRLSAQLHRRGSSPSEPLNRALRALRTEDIRLMDSARRAWLGTTTPCTARCWRLCRVEECTERARRGAHVDGRSLRRSGPAAPRFSASTGAPAAVGVPLSVVVWCLLDLPRPPEQRFRFSGESENRPALAIVFSVREIWEGQCCFLLGVCAALL
jgi:hypothetical protein